MIESLLNERFWLEWQRDFESDATTTWIVPDDPEVERATSKALSTPLVTDTTVNDRATKIWQWIDSNIEYTLTKQWKRPPELLRERVGDCEDHAFLFASMALQAGVDPVTLQIGYIKLRDQEHPHVWNVVDDTIVDTTIAPDEKLARAYRPVKTYKLGSDPKQ